MHSSAESFRDREKPLRSPSRRSIRSRPGRRGSRQAGNRFDSIGCLLPPLQPDRNCFTVIFSSLQWKSTEGGQAGCPPGTPAPLRHLFSVQAGTKQNPLGKTSPEISGDLQQGIKLNPQPCIALVSSPYSSVRLLEVCV